MLVVVTTSFFDGASQLAIECPCHVRSRGGADAAKRSMRVCIPASLSTRSVCSSCQAIRNLAGTRMMAAPPYALHCWPAASSAAGFHASASLRPSGVSGTRV